MTNLELPFALTDGERAHPLWRKIETELEKMLANKRGKNDDAGLDEIQTAALRGEINMLKAILRLGEELPPN